MPRSIILKITKFTQKSKISVNTENFAKSSLEERFGSESGRIQVFDIFNSHSTLYYLENLRNSLKNRKFPSTLKTLQKVHLKNVSEVKVEEVNILIFITHSKLYYLENLRNSLKNRKFPSTLKSLQKVHLKNVSEVKVEEF